MASGGCLRHLSLDCSTNPKPNWAQPLQPSPQGCYSRSARCSVRDGSGVAPGGHFSWIRCASSCWWPYPRNPRARECTGDLSLPICTFSPASVPNKRDRQAGFLSQPLPLVTLCTLFRNLSVFPFVNWESQKPPLGVPGGCCTLANSTVTNSDTSLCALTSHLQSRIPVDTNS